MSEMTPAQEALWRFAQRMDEIALFEPKTQSWESIYKKARRELGEHIAESASVSGGKDCP